MYRREILGTLAAGGSLLFAGCFGSNVDGEVVSNETPLVFSHEYSTQATYTGTRIVVDVEAKNEGTEPITPKGSVPEVVCTFLDGSGNQIHQSGLTLAKSIGVGETITLEFALAVDVDSASRYTLQSKWVDA
jgi:hypothetical protein